MQLIDLSSGVLNSSSGQQQLKVKVKSHAGGSKFGRKLVFVGKRTAREKLLALSDYVSGKKRITKSSFPDGECINEEIVTLSVHTGTHLDSPAHYGTRCEGKTPKTIEQIPLSWCYGDGVMLTIHKKPGAEITAKDLDEETNRIGYKIKAGDIVLINTGAYKKWGTPRYFFDAPGLGKEGTKHLIDQGVKVIGTDAFSLDRPFTYMVNDYYRTKDSGYLWPAHTYGREKEYCQLEKLSNLDEIPCNFGFKVCCFPVKFMGLSASFVRAVAIVE